MNREFGKKNSRTPAGPENVKLLLTSSLTHIEPDVYSGSTSVPNLGFNLDKSAARAFLLLFWLTFASLLPRHHAPRDMQQEQQPRHPGGTRCTGPAQSVCSRDRSLGRCVSNSSLSRLQRLLLFRGQPDKSLGNLKLFTTET